MNKLFASIINKFYPKYNMKDHNNNPNSFGKEVSGQSFTAKDTIVTVQHISKNIRDYSLNMREIIKTFRKSGAIPEIAEAIRDASFAVRDTAKEINEATQELKKNGVVGDTANAVEVTLKSAEDSIKTVKEITTDAGKVSPYTTKIVQGGIDRVKKETSQVTEKIRKGVKTKEGVL